MIEQDVSLLYKAVLALETEEECRLFFEDLCTGKEIGTMLQRLSVAKMLYENCNYAEIVEKTGASTATVSRVKRSCDHYHTVLNRIDKKGK